jgi:hypothetical protein
MGIETARGAAFFFVCDLAQVATYIMAAVRWFSTHHDSFWYGFKELIWASVPIVNFTYVWDWWVSAFLFVLSLFGLLR